MLAEELRRAAARRTTVPPPSAEEVRQIAQLNPWWRGQVSQGSEPGVRLIPASLAFFYDSAMLNSGQIRAFGDLPALRELSVDEVEGRLAPRAYFEARLQDFADPTTSLAQTRGSNRLLRRDREIEGGLRQRTLAGTQITVGQRFLSLATNDSNFDPSRQTTSRTFITIVQPILREGGLGYGRSVHEIARLDSRAALAEFRRQLETHLLEVARAYWAVYLTRTVLLQKERLAADTRALARELRGREAIDVDRILIERVNAAAAVRDADLLRARLAVRNANLRVLALTNDPRFDEQGIGGFLPTNRPLSRALPVEPADLLDQMLEKRAEIQALLYQHQQAVLRSGLAENETLPRLDVILEGSIGGRGLNEWRYGDAFSQSNPRGRAGGLLGLRFEQPLTRSDLDARAAQRRIEVRQVENQAIATLSTLILEGEVAVNEYRTAVRDLPARAVAWRAAQAEAARLAERFRRGLGQGIAAAVLDRQIDAQDRLQAAAERLAIAEVTATIAFLNVQRASGNFLDVEGIGIDRLDDQARGPTSVGRRGSGQPASAAGGWQITVQPGPGRQPGEAPRDDPPPFPRPHPRARPSARRLRRPPSGARACPPRPPRRRLLRRARPARPAGLPRHRPPDRRSDPNPTGDRRHRGRFGDARLPLRPRRRPLLRGPPQRVGRGVRLSDPRLRRAGAPPRRRGRRDLRSGGRAAASAAHLKPEGRRNTRDRRDGRSDEQGRSGSARRALAAMLASGLLRLPGRPAAKPPARPASASLWQGLSAILFTRLPLGDLGPLVRLLSPVLGPLFSPPGLAVWALLSLAATASVLADGRRFAVETLALLSPDLATLATGALVFVVTKALHEVGHAVAAARFARAEGLTLTVFPFGLGFMVGMPVPWIDLTGAWVIGTRWRRAAIGLAGVYVEAWLSALAAIAWAFAREGALGMWPLKVVPISGASAVLFNLNPLLRLDGYHVLVDLFGTANLAPRARAATGTMLRRLFGGAEAPPPRAGRLVAYHLAASAWRVAVLAAAFWFAAAAHRAFGVAVAIAVFGLFVARPLLNGICWLAKGGVKRPARFAAASAAGAMLAAAALLVPLPERIVAEGVTVADGAALVFAPSDGRLIVVAPPGPVRAGETVLAVENAEAARLEAQLALEQEAVMLRLREAAGQGPAQIAALNARLAAVAEQRARLAEEIARGRVVADCDSLWQPDRAAALRGAWVRGDDPRPLGLLMPQPAGLRLEVALDQREGPRVAETLREGTVFVVRPRHSPAPRGAADAALARARAPGRRPACRRSGRPGRDPRRQAAVRL